MDPATSGVLSRLRTLTKSKQPGSSAPERDRPRRFKSIRDEALQIPAGISEFDQWRNQVGQLNPRAPGLANDAAQFFKKVLRRLLSWYTRPLNHSDAALSGVLWRLSAIVEALSRAGIGTEEEIDRLKSEVKSGDSQPITLTEMKLLLHRVEALSGTVSQLRADVDSSIKSRQHVHTLDFVSSTAVREEPGASAGLGLDSDVQLSVDANGSLLWRANTERIVEQAWTLRNLGHVSLESRILCLASADDILPIQLASSGHKVTGIDVRHYPFKHPNFTSVQGSFLTMDIPADRFDVVVAFSMIDPVGFVENGGSNYRDEIELRIGKIHEVLKAGGLFVTAVPIGTSAAGSVPDFCRLNDGEPVFGNFSVQKIQFGLRLDDRTWITSVDRSLAAMWPSQGAARARTAVAMMVLEKV